MIQRCYERNTKKSGGQAALLTVVLILFAMLILIGTVSGLALRGAKVAELDYKSRRSYFLSESGSEDAAYRLISGKNLPSWYELALYPASGGATTSVSVADVLGGKEILSSASLDTLQRAVKSLLKTGTGVSFHYGVQVGEGGLEMGNGSKIIGDVFSNGNISGGGSSQSRITGTAQAAGNHSISDIRVGNNAWAQSFSNCIVDGVASYLTGFSGCTASSTEVMSQTTQPQVFPITEAQINSWKADAAAGGTQSSYTLGNGSSGSLGPKKINGDITLGNGAALTLTGTVWVTGTVNVGNNEATIGLAPAYGDLSGVLIVDGKVNLGNKVILQGSGAAGSYLMLLVMTGGDDAIEIGNNATAAIFYAPNGEIEIGNGLSLREVTGYSLEVGNNASVTYESGLANVNFSSGPSGGWQIDYWKEVTPP